MNLKAIFRSLQNPKVEAIALFCFILIATILFISGIPAVPFHPDESTYLFMSSDFDLLLKHPISMAWSPGLENDPRMRYRLLDAPLTRYILGAARKLTGISPLPSDWSWSLSWEENVQIGALPDPQLLNTGRLVISLFYPFELLLIYCIGKQWGGRRLAWIALVLFASNPLLLLHTRRAMAEGILIFTILLSIFCLFMAKKHPWIASIPVALAFCAKQSTISLIAVSMLVIVVRFYQHRPKKRELFTQLIAFSAIFLVIYYLLNPFTWLYPFQSNLLAIQLRQGLLSEQISTIAAVNPEHILTSIPTRLVGMIGNLFYTPPAIADVANYLPFTQSSADIYLSNPFNHNLRGFGSGTIYLVLTLIGCGLLMKGSRKVNDRQFPVVILLIAAFLQFLSLIISIPLTFQRYIIPLIPYVILFAATGLDGVIAQTIQVFNSKSVPPVNSNEKD